MNSSLLRKWITCFMMVAVLVNMATPVAMCECEGCACERNVAKFRKSTPPAEEKSCSCCKTPTESPCDMPAERKCCGSSDTSCSCCDAAKDFAVAAQANLLVKKQDFDSLWSIAAVSLTPRRDVPSCFYSYRGLPPPHVPLHVLLCVFLN